VPDVIARNDPGATDYRKSRKEQLPRHGCRNSSLLLGVTVEYDPATPPPVAITDAVVGPVSGCRAPYLTRPSRRWEIDELWRARLKG
jgi:hypothetical protein